MRPVILKLATKISLESGTYTGVTPNDPEYKILDPVLTDEMAECMVEAVLVGRPERQRRPVPLEIRWRF